MFMARDGCLCLRHWRLEGVQEVWVKADRA